jgi:hypothetical protein
MKPPFRSATSGQKQTSPLAGTGNSETFEYKVDYAWIDISGSGGTFMFSYSDAETEAIFDSPRNSATFEYKVDLLLNSPSGPPLGTNPNVAPCQIRTVRTVSICGPKNLFFSIFVPY